MASREGPARAASGAPVLTVAAVAARLGVAPATLRTWDRRYGLGPSSRLAGSHRRYGSTDLARLLVMRRLTLDGVAPAEAARVARDTPAEELDDVDGALARVVPIGAEPAEAHHGPVTVTAVVDAALALDTARCRRILSAGLNDGCEKWWTGLVAPARNALAARTVLARPGEDAHALLDSTALSVLRKRPEPAADLDADSKLVLVTSPGDGTSTLVLHALAAALVEKSVGARVLTGPVSVRHLVELCLMAGPLAVVVVSDRDRADLSIVAALHDELPELSIFVGTVDEAAARELPLHRGVHRSRTFTGLVHEASAVTGVITHRSGPLDH